MADAQNPTTAREELVRESDRLFLSILRANAQGADELRRRLTPAMDADREVREARAG